MFVLFSCDRAEQAPRPTDVGSELVSAGAEPTGQAPETFLADVERLVVRQAGTRSQLTRLHIYEHRITERSIASLERKAAKPTPDAAVFSRDALHLMGLQYAHFEDEEEVLLPIPDTTMTPEEFNREVAGKVAH